MCAKRDDAGLIWDLASSEVSRWVSRCQWAPPLGRCQVLARRATRCRDRLVDRRRRHQGSPPSIPPDILGNSRPKGTPLAVATPIARRAASSARPRPPRFQRPTILRVKPHLCPGRRSTRHGGVGLETRAGAPLGSERKAVHPRSSRPARHRPHLSRRGLVTGERESDMSRPRCRSPPLDSRLLRHPRDLIGTNTCQPRTDLGVPKPDLLRREVAEEEVRLLGRRGAGVRAVRHSGSEGDGPEQRGRCQAGFGVRPSGAAGRHCDDRRDSANRWGQSAGALVAKRGGDSLKPRSDSSERGCGLVKSSRLDQIAKGPRRVAELEASCGSRCWQSQVQVVPPLCCLTSHTSPDVSTRLPARTWTHSRKVMDPPRLPKLQFIRKGFQLPCDHAGILASRTTAGHS